MIGQALGGASLVQWLQGLLANWGTRSVVEAVSSSEKDGLSLEIPFDESYEDGV